MRAVVQRVSEARVEVAGEVVGRIGHGMLVLLGVGREDDEASARALATRIAQLRVFDDDQGRMNLALADVGGAMLVVSQFTLWATPTPGGVPRGAAPPRGRRRSRCTGPSWSTCAASGSRSRRGASAPTWTSTS